MPTQANLEHALQIVDAGLSMGERVAGLFGRLRTPAKRANYARWRFLRLELRAVKLEARNPKRAAMLKARAAVWAQEADRLEAITCS